MVKLNQDLEQLIALYLTKAKNVTTQMRIAAKEDRIDALTKLTANRDRLYNLLTQMMEHYRVANNNSLPRELQILIHQLTREEATLLEDLEEWREKIQLEISTTFKNKESHKAFNLNKVK